MVIAGCKESCSRCNAFRSVLLPWESHTLEKQHSLEPGILGILFATLTCSSKLPGVLLHKSAARSALQDLHSVLQSLQGHLVSLPSLLVWVGLGHALLLNLGEVLVDGIKFCLDTVKVRGSLRCDLAQDFYCFGLGSNVLLFDCLVQLILISLLDVLRLGGLLLLLEVCNGLGKVGLHDLQNADDLPTSALPFPILEKCCILLLILGVVLAQHLQSLF